MYKNKVKKLELRISASAKGIIAKLSAFVQYKAQR